jgi:hypothetical protein
MENNSKKQPLNQTIFEKDVEWANFHVFVNLAKTSRCEK